MSAMAAAPLTVALFRAREDALALGRGAGRARLRRRVRARRRDSRDRARSRRRAVRFRRRHQRQGDRIRHRPRRWRRRAGRRSTSSASRPPPPRAGPVSRRQRVAAEIAALLPQLPAGRALYLAGRDRKPDLEAALGRARRRSSSTRPARAPAWDEGGGARGRRGERGAALFRAQRGACGCAGGEGGTGGGVPAHAACLPVARGRGAARGAWRAPRALAGGVRTRRRCSMRWNRRSPITSASEAPHSQAFVARPRYRNLVKALGRLWPRLATTKPRTARRRGRRRRSASGSPSSSKAERARRMRPKRRPQPPKGRASRWRWARSAA